MGSHVEQTCETCVYNPNKADICRWCVLHQSNNLAHLRKNNSYWRIRPSLRPAERLGGKR